LLVEFASVVDAVRCAVEIQREMIARNIDVPAERRLEFRMGINVGELIRNWKREALWAAGCASHLRLHWPPPPSD
jgi:hypothetical protein